MSEVKPQHIIEIGTNQGKRALEMIIAAQMHHRHVRYTGFDLFDAATPETNAAELNGKPPARLSDVHSRLGVTGAHIALFKGNTRETLHRLNLVADLVFIDGGHSRETIQGDYLAVKRSPVIVFDDYYTPEVLGFGCNEVVKVLQHHVLPVEDKTRIGEGVVGIKLVRVG